MSVTLQRVAEAAGVSVATASRALGGKGRVSRATVERVRATADRLGYQVNTFGKALREGSDEVAGIIVPMVSNPYYASLVHAFEDKLDRVGLKLLIADSHGELDREVERLNALVSRRVRGVFVVPGYFERSRPTIVQVAREVPLVQVDRRVADDAELAYVGVDNAGGMMLALRHVADQGAQHVVFVGADDRTSVGRERADTFVAGAETFGLSVQPPIRDRYLFDFGLSAVDRLLGRSELPDAVVAGDDLIASGLLAGFIRHGVSVPGDVMVTGFDGTLLADLCSPTLTTVQQPMAEIASAAVDQLLRQVDGDHGSCHVRLRTSLRPAESTGKRSPRPTPHRAT